MDELSLAAQCWIPEYVTTHDFYLHSVRQILLRRQTRYQDLLLVESPTLGKVLILDGKWQSATADEFQYHEALVHPACIFFEHPRSALVLGGGEGATLRELLRWKSLERVTMVDLDEEVVDVCREHLSEMHQGAFSDPRCEVVISDAAAFVRNTEVAWDVVFSDLSDPIENGPASHLYTLEFFQEIVKKLSPGGIFAIQTGPIGPTNADLERHARLIATLRYVFPQVSAYIATITTYPAVWTFAIGTNRKIPDHVEPGQVDSLIATGTSGGLRMLDGQAMKGMFCLPLHLRQAQQRYSKVYTLSDRPVLFGSGILGHKDV